MSKSLKKFAIAFTVLYTNLVVILMWVEHSAGKLKFDRLVFFTVPVMAGAMFLFFISRTINRYVEEGESVQVYAPLRFWGRSWEVQTLLGFIFCYFYFDDFNLVSVESWIVNSVRAFGIPICLGLIVTIVLHIVNEGINERREKNQQPSGDSAG
jgi:hypothetical protein